MNGANHDINMSFTPTIEKRFRLLFRFYDLNKDGQLDSKDHDKLTQTYASVYKTDAAPTVKQECDKWWSVFQQHGIDQTVTEEEYINVVRFMFVNDFEQFRKSLFKLYEATFSLIDHDKDNRISPDELINYYASFNVTDTDRVKKIFKKLDLNHDGFVTRDEWIIARLDYATLDDPDHDFGFTIDFSAPIPESRSTCRLTPGFLKRYKIGFRFFDTNKDCIQTVDDYLLAADNMCNLHSVGEKERAALRHTAIGWWKQLEPFAINGEITEEHFAYLMITKLVTDMDQARLDVFEIFRPWFNVADRDGDGMISEEEFLTYYAAFGRKDMDKVKKIFKRVDLDDDGFISEEEWILVILDYWTRDDGTYDYGFVFDVE